MAGDLGIQASAISQRCGFFLALGKLLKQSKELYKSYLLTRSLDDMEQAVRRAQEILDLVSPEVSSMHIILGTVVPGDLLFIVPIIEYSLARSLLRKFQHTRQVEDVTKAMEMFRCAFFQLVRGHDEVMRNKCFRYWRLSYKVRDGNLDGFPEVDAFASQLGKSLQSLPFASGSLEIHSEDLGKDDEMLDYFRSTLLDLICQWSREVRSKDLDVVIELCGQALIYFSRFSDDATNGLMLTKLGWYLIVKFVKQGEFEGIEEAIEYCRVGLELVSLMSPSLGDHLIHASKACLLRCQVLRRREDLDNVVRCVRTAMKVVDSQTPKQFGCLENPELSASARQLGLSLEALETLPNNLGANDEMFGYFRITLLDLKDRWKPEANLRSLVSVIQLCRQALKLCPLDPSNKGFILTELGMYLIGKFVYENKPEDIQGAVECCRVGLQLLSPTSPSFEDCLIHASKAYAYQSLFLKEQGLDIAIGYARQAMEVIDSQSPKFLMCLGMLAEALYSRFRTTGDNDDLDVAIDAQSKAIDAKERDGYPCPVLLTNLAQLLYSRANRSCRSEDLSETVLVAQRALNLLSANDPRRISYLSNLSLLEFEHFMHLGDSEYLDRGFRHSQEAFCISVERIWSFESSGDDYGIKLNHETMLFLITSIVKRTLVTDILYSFQGASEALDSVIATARDVMLNRPHHPLAGTSHFFLLCCLFQRWRRTQEVKDIDEAISLARRMVKITEADAEQSALDLVALGTMLYSRYQSTGDLQNRAEALASVLKGFQTPGSSPYIRIRAGHLAIDILFELQDWEHARQLSWRF